MYRNYFQLLKCPPVLPSIISVDDAKDLHFGIELIKKMLYFFFAYHYIVFFGAKVIKVFEKCKKNNLKVVNYCFLHLTKSGNVSQGQVPWFTLSGR